MTPIDRATAALIAELRRQGEARGVVVEDNGSSAQIDGSFLVEPLVRAVIAAIREPSEAQRSRGLVALKMAVGSPDYDYAPHQNDAAEVFTDMIDALLEDGR